MSGPATMPRGSALLMVVLISVSALNPLAVNMFVPAMPDMIRALDTDLAHVQLVLSAYLFATAVAQLILGPLSDRFGRRPVLIGGLVVFIVASIACTFAPNIGVLIAARVMQGVGGCAGVVISRAIVRDRFDRESAATALGYVTMGFAIAPMVGPTIGGLVNDSINWNSIFGIQSLLGVLTLVMVLVALPETLRPLKPGETRHGFVESFKELVRIPAFWSYAMTLSFGVSVFFSFLGGTPIIASELLGMSGTEFGLFFLFVPGGFIVGNYLTARYSSRLGISVMMIMGTSIAVAAVTVMGTLFALGINHPLALFGPMYAVGFANGLTFANAIVGAISLRPEYAGTASGIAGSFQITGGAIASVLIGVLLSVNNSVFVLLSLMMIFALASLAAATWSRTART